MDNEKEFELGEKVIFTFRGLTRICTVKFCESYSCLLYIPCSNLSGEQRSWLSVYDNSTRTFICDHQYIKKIPE